MEVNCTVEPGRKLPECGVARFFYLLEGPWASLIVKELFEGPHRFTELRKALPGISPHTLTSRLRQFETHGIVTRRAYAEVPPRVEYELTELGQRLRPVVAAMGEWALTVPDPSSTDDDSASTPQAHAASVSS